MRTLQIPATYWDDFAERCPVDSPEQMPVEVGRAGCRVTVQADETQAAYLLSDARFYAEGNTDDTPRAVISGAKRVAELLRA
jgi:hypothetical protein